MTVQDVGQWYERVHKEEKAAAAYALGELGYRNTAEQHQRAQAMGAMKADPWSDNDWCPPLHSLHHAMMSVPVLLPPIDGTSRVPTAGPPQSVPPATAPRSIARGSSRGSLASKRTSSSRYSMKSLREHVAHSVEEEVARIDQTPLYATRREKLTAMLNNAKGL
mmetsp:Transcript_34799/g.63373  ORF Transcript_34799/g.63373 Transcript_34799/m.63373 type:complete len:164 (-) Transcript_34799:40-531(-)